MQTSDKNSNKKGRNHWLDLTSLLTWITVIAVVTVFWIGITTIFEGNYISHAITKLFHTTVSHLAKE